MIMEEKDTELRDEGLRGNEKIEEAIAGLQQEPTQEMLAHALTVVRRRMKENGQLIVAVRASGWRRSSSLFRTVRNVGQQTVVGCVYRI